MDEALDYMVGDCVYLECVDLHSSRHSNKLDFQCFGSFKVSQKILDTAYRMSLPDGWAIHDVFHISCLVPAYEDTILGRWQELQPQVQLETGNEVEIEQILKEQWTRGGMAEFLVRWKGYDESEDKWLKEYDMPHAMEVIQEFKENERTHGKHCHGGKKS